MAGKKHVESTKKAAGNAKKAANAAAKAEAVNARKAAIEDAEWAKGAKSNAKKEAAEAKKREAAARKAANAAVLAEEEASLPSKPKVNPKAPARRSRGIDDALSSFTSSAPALNASGIDNALDALSLTSDTKAVTVDRHPERRFKAAYAAYEERRLPEVKEENKGLRLNQMKELIRKEFEKSEENPFNQSANVKYDATKDEVLAKKKEEREMIERRLAGN